jgi:hypothetical protein
LRCRHSQRLIHFAAVQSYPCVPFASKALLSPLRRLSAVLGTPITCSQNLPLAMASDLFTAEQEEIIRGNPIKSIDALRGSLPEYLSSFEQDIDEGT